jgi:nicotinate-nucleotide adenylyltransferase
LKTIIYGGAFNPPTVAHQSILSACTDLAEQMDGEVWLLPSGNRTDKTISVPLDVRLGFLEAMRQDDNLTNLIQIKDLELFRPVAIETYDTMQELTSLYPDREFYWVFGADSTQTMHEWHQGDWIVDNANIIAVNRTGFDVNEKIKHITKLDIECLDISSTLVRNRVVTGEMFDNLVIPSVHEMINNLHKEKALF